MSNIFVIENVDIPPIESIDTSKHSHGRPVFTPFNTGEYDQKSKYDSC